MNIYNNFFLRNQKIYGKCMCVESSDNVYMFNIGKHMNDSIDIHVQCHNKPTFTCTSLVLCRHSRLVQYTRCTHSSGAIH